MKNITKIICCFNSLTTTTIEILIIILSAIGMILCIIGMIIIPWGYTSKIMEIFYIIDLILFFYSLILSIIILFLHKKKWNDNILDYCYISCFVQICACVLSIIFYIYIAIGTIPDLKNKKTIEHTQTLGPDGEVQKITQKEKKLTSSGELAYTIFSIVINIIICVCLLLLWISELIRLKYKIEGTFNDYEMKNKKLSMDSTDNSNFDVVGHDKYGNPIFNKKNDENFKIAMSRGKYNYKPNDKYTSSIYDIEGNNILKYSYKEKYNGINGNILGHKSVDAIQKLKKEKKDKYIEKYVEGEVNPYYSNFDNKSAFNISSFNNNSIHPLK